MPFHEGHERDALDRPERSNTEGKGMTTDTKIGQEGFDLVNTHLLTQMETCESSGGGCRYHGEHGLKCAIGILIEDGTYFGEMEALGPWELVEECGMDPLGLDSDMLNELQGIHDGNSSGLWFGLLCEFAEKHGFTFNPPCTA